MRRKVHSNVQFSFVNYGDDKGLYGNLINLARSRDMDKFYKLRLFPNATHKALLSAFRSDV